MIYARQCRQSFTAVKVQSLLKLKKCEMFVKVSQLIMMASNLIFGSSKNYHEFWFYRF